MKRPKGLRHLLLFMGIQKKGNSDCEILIIRRIDIGKLKRKERFGALPLLAYGSILRVMMVVSQCENACISFDEFSTMYVGSTTLQASPSVPPHLSSTCHSTPHTLTYIARWHGGAGDGVRVEDMMSDSQ